MDHVIQATYLTELLKATTLERGIAYEDTSFPMKGNMDVIEHRPNQRSMRVDTLHRISRVIFVQDEVRLDQDCLAWQDKITQRIPVGASKMLPIHPSEVEKVSYGFIRTVAVADRRRRGEWILRMLHGWGKGADLAI
jgi:hypothetical protein